MLLAVELGYAVHTGLPPVTQSGGSRKGEAISSNASPWRRSGRGLTIDTKRVCARGGGGQPQGVCPRHYHLGSIVVVALSSQRGAGH